MLGKRALPKMQSSDIQAFYKQKNVHLKEGEDLPGNWVELEREWELQAENLIHDGEVGMHPDAPMMNQPTGELSEAIVQDLER